MSDLERMTGLLIAALALQDVLTATSGSPPMVDIAMDSVSFSWSGETHTGRPRYEPMRWEVTVRLRDDGSRALYVSADGLTEAEDRGSTYGGRLWYGIERGPNGGLREV